MAISEKTLYRLIDEKLTSGMSYAEIAKELLPDHPLSTTKSMLYRFYTRHQRIRNNGIRVALGLPRLIEVVSCQECGEVHTHNCKSHMLKRKNAEWPERPPRFPIYVGREHLSRTVRSIRSHMDEETIQELVIRLEEYGQTS